MLCTLFYERFTSTDQFIGVIVAVWFLLLSLLLSFVSVARSASHEASRRWDAPACAQEGDAGRGSLRPHPTNPRYFSHAGQERPIYLVGSHTWNNLVDMDAKRPLREFDFTRYVAFLKAHRHNLIRLWTWEVPSPRSTRYERRQMAEPQPWPRVGPELDASGLPKFDLAGFDNVYFERLRKRVSYAESQGLYVIVMLFEGWAVQFAPGKDSHPFKHANNINGIDYGNDPRHVHTLKIPAITRIQEAYVRRVIDAIGDCTNVLFEIANESGDYSTAWQLHMIQFIRSYEQSKSVRHPVGMTFQINGYNSTLVESPADWFSPYWADGNYMLYPRPATGAKVVLSDTDHLGGSAVGDQQWVWKSFVRGLNLLFMDRYERPDSVTDRYYAKAQEVRMAMGQTLLYAERINLAQMTPRTDISSGEFALASATEYLIYEPNTRKTRVDLRRAPPIQFRVEWFNPSTGRVVIDDPVIGGEEKYFMSPFKGDFVLYIYPFNDRDKKDIAIFENAAQKLYLDANSYIERSSAEKISSLIKSLVVNIPHKQFLAMTAIGLGIGLLIGLSIRGKKSGAESG